MVLVNHQAFIFVDGALFAAYGQGGKVPMQEIGGQSGEGAYF